MLCVNVDIHMYWKFWEDVKQVGWVGRVFKMKLKMSSLS